MAFHLLFSLYFTGAGAGRKWLIGTALGLALWIFNFYLVLSWLQPVLQGENWIVRMVPPWVGALTHLSFAWTMVVGELWGSFDPYRPSK